MPRAIIIHGTGGNPSRHWFPWLRGELTQRGIEAKSPQFPTTEGQSLSSWTATFQREAGPLTPDTILIGHSIGSGFMCNLLHHSPVKIRASFFVAGFLGALEIPTFDPLNASFFTEKFDWDKIKRNAGETFVYAGDDDPFVPLSKTIELARCLKSELIVLPGGGHINKDSGFERFPRLLRDLDLLGPPVSRPALSLGAEPKMPV